MSLHVEGSLGTLSFFGILCISAPFHEQGTLPLSKQVLNMLLRVGHDICLVDFRVS